MVIKDYIKATKTKENFLPYLSVNRLEMIAPKINPKKKLPVIN